MGLFQKTILAPLLVVAACETIPSTVGYDGETVYGSPPSYEWYTSASYNTRVTHFDALCAPNGMRRQGEQYYKCLSRGVYATPLSVFWMDNAPELLKIKYFTETCLNYGYTVGDRKELAQCAREERNKARDNINAFLQRQHTERTVRAIESAESRAQSKAFRKSMDDFAKAINGGKAPF